MSVLETSGENPLLDSRFPDVSGKGRGYQLQACNSGTQEWPSLRKVSIWQTVGALEQVPKFCLFMSFSHSVAQEFREKAAEFAQSKSRIELKLKKIGGSRDSGDEAGPAEGKGVDSAGEFRRDRADSDERCESKQTAPAVSSALSVRAEDKSGHASTPLKSNAVPVTVDAKSPSLAHVPESGGISSPSGLLEPLRNARLTQQALPHHIPKMDALSRKMDDIRKTMGEEVSRCCLSRRCQADFVQGLKAPWDSRGRPLGAIGSADHK